ncbi:MAG: hypothetical protein IJ716_08255 [Lachnospiraceae bacterium]|nr:hypothetical protein [Lachnospiraceae bacterium]MBR1852674.1 hypothetical protein [Lachnospiraceae bacterium]
MNVFIVYGAPASGKTTYVKKHKKTNDLIVDFDLIKQSITMNDKTEDVGCLFDIAEHIRQYLYQIIENRMVKCENAWIIGLFPKAADRNEIAKRLRAKLIYIKASEQQCIARAMHDDERKDKELQLRIIEKWFVSYTDHAFDNIERWD